MFLRRKKEEEEEKVEVEEEDVAEKNGWSSRGRRKEEEEDDEEEDSDDDENDFEKEERMRLERVHTKLSQELERAVATLGVVEDGAITNKETLGIYDKYGASLQQASGLVGAIGARRRRRQIILWVCIIYFIFTVLFNL